MNIKNKIQEINNEINKEIKEFNKEIKIIEFDYKNLKFLIKNHFLIKNINKEDFEIEFLIKTNYLYSKQREELNFNKLYKNGKINK